MKLSNGDIKEANGREVRRGRWTAEVDGDFVVFLIGMRINRWRAVRQWLPVVTAMPAMLRELTADPESAGTASR